MNIQRGNDILKNWDYSELSKVASKHGGPSKYVNFLMETSEKKGLEKGVAIGFVLAIPAVYGMVKLKNYIISRKDEKLESGIIKNALIKELQINTEENEAMLMKKYGIEIYEKDNTIGGKSRSTWTEWFDSEEKRDNEYQFYTEKRTSSPSDMLIEMEIASSPYIDGDEATTRTYTKIEEAIQ